MSAEWITRNEVAPQSGLDGLWESIVVEEAIKERLQNQALLSFGVRAKVRFSVSALHALILVYGPPGTGKTTLARGLPQVLAPLVGDKKVRLIEVDPHGLMSAEHGQSQQRVTELLCDTIPQLCDDGLPAIVVLNEVESMAVARSEASLAANPADVHRATDAVLMALDRNADSYPHIVTIATSNFTGALDDAFRSRADLRLRVPMPSAAACAEILRKTLEGFSEAYEPFKHLAGSKDLKGLGEQLHEQGLDGRQIRKLVTEGMGMRREVVVDPGSLAIADIEAAAERLKSEIEQEGQENAAA